MLLLCHHVLHLSTALMSPPTPVTYLPSWVSNSLTQHGTTDAHSWLQPQPHLMLPVALVTLLVHQPCLACSWLVCWQIRLVLPKHELFSSLPVALSYSDGCQKALRLALPIPSHPAVDEGRRQVISQKHGPHYLWTPAPKWIPTAP